MSMAVFNRIRFAAADVGERRTWSDGVEREKQADGTWKKVSDGGASGSDTGPLWENEYDAMDAAAAADGWGEEDPFADNSNPAADAFADDIFDEAYGFEEAYGYEDALGIPGGSAVNVSPDPLDPFGPDDGGNLADDFYIPPAEEEDDAPDTGASLDDILASWPDDGGSIADDFFMPPAGEEEEEEDTFDPNAVIDDILAEYRRGGA